MNKNLFRHTVLVSLISAATLTLTATPVTAQDAMALPAPAAATVSYSSIQVDGLKIAYREAGDPKNPKLVLLHGFPAGSHQYRDLIRSLAGKFHVIAPDYPGFGESDIPDPASYHYSFDGISTVVEHFLQAKGFDHYGLFVQDYGGPVGFRIVGRNPKALDWLIIQNSNAYEVGFTAAWDGFRGALWKNRSPETEKPLAGFLTKDAIKGIYLHGAEKPELISPDNWESDAAYMQAHRRARQPRPVLRLPHERRSVSEVASVSAQQPAQDADLLGPDRHLLHAGRWRFLPEGPAESRNASTQGGALRGRGPPRLHLWPDAALLCREGCDRQEDGHGPRQVKARS